MSHTNLIIEIIAAAKRLNISQNELANRAGIRPETLSRAKSNPNIRLGTLQELARVVGLRLQLVPDHPVADQVREGTLFPS
jgi:transcriptional regulator with XRE-family HTH domain